MDVQKYIDQIRNILEDGDEISAERLSGILESLPFSGPAQTSSKTEENVDALLVMTKGVQRKLVTTDLSNNGFELAYTDHPLDAFRLNVSLKPNLVITSLEFDNLSGLELAKASRGVDVMSETPVVLLTSMRSRECPTNSPHTAEPFTKTPVLPPNWPMPHRNSNFPPLQRARIPRKSDTLKR